MLVAVCIVIYLAIGAFFGFLIFLLRRGGEPLTNSSTSDSPKFTSGQHIDSRVTLVSDRRERIEEALIPSTQTVLKATKSLWQRAKSLLQRVLALRSKSVPISPLPAATDPAGRASMVFHIVESGLPLLDPSTPVSQCAGVLTGFCSSCGLRLFGPSNPMQTAFCQCVLIL